MCAPLCREKVGKWFIQLCGTTPCMVNGAEEIRATIEKHLGIKEGGAWMCGCVIWSKPALRLGSPWLGSRYFAWLNGFDGF
jgi:hypothetical protein